MDLKSIKSRENPRIKKIKKLGLKKYRQKFEMFAVENWATIRDALESGHIFDSLFVTREFAEKNENELKMLEEKDLAKDVFLMDNDINKHISALSTPAGVVAVYEMKEEGIKESGSVIYLNGINDPGNLGGILRTCLAFGFENVVLDKDCADIYNPKTLNAAKNSIFNINILRCDDDSWIRSNSLPLYAASVEGGESLEEVEVDPDLCLVFGSEAHGVSGEILDMADKKINIPMSGRIESLNVSVAASIFLYRLRRV